MLIRKEIGARLTYVLIECVAESPRKSRCWEEAWHEAVGKPEVGSGDEVARKPNAPTGNFAYSPILSRDSFCLASPPGTQ